jgi:Mg-chelatase subunit ChlD
MHRRLILLLALVLPALASDKARSTWAEARDELERSYFDELDADKRDRLFEAYGEYDNREAIAPLAEIVSRYGVYMLGLEGELASLAGRIKPYLGRTSMTDEEAAVRNNLQKKIDEKEKEMAGAHATLELVVGFMGRYEKPQTLQTAITLFGKHDTWRVRQVLALTCGRWHKFMKDAKTSKIAFRALKQLVTDDEEKVRVAATRSLGHFKDEGAALELLKKSVRDPDWSVRAAAVHSLGQHRNSAAVNVLVQTMQGQKGRLVDDINKVLRSITGKTYDYPEQWKGWWKGQGGKLPTNRTKPEEAPKPGKKRKDDSRFYGIPTNSDRICYIIDTSGSMKKEVEQWKRVTITGRKQRDEQVQGKTRIEVARNELKRAVGNLNSQKRFAIIFFNHAAKPWRPDMTKASPNNKKAAIADIDKVSALGATYTLGALRMAFTMAGVINSPGATKKDGAGVDTIFLLSDGGPTDNKLAGPKPMDPDILLEQVKQWNRDAGIVIHTIAVDTDEAGTYFLKNLAAQNGGEFVERRNPNKKAGKK